MDFQSLIGTLHFACKVVVPGRTFLQRMINLTSGVPSRFHHIRMNKQFQRDITMWNVLEGTACTVRHCTIKIYLAAVRNLHIVSGYNDPLQGKLLLKKILRAILRYQGCSRISRQPVTPPVQLAIRPVLDSWMDVRDFSMIWATLTLAFFAFLCCSKFTYPGACNFSSQFNLTTDCVIFSPSMSHP